MCMCVCVCVYVCVCVCVCVCMNNCSVAQASAFAAAMSALFHDKFEAALSKTTQELSDEVNKNKQRYQLLLKKFNGKVSTEMRVEFAQYKALELCHSIDTLVAQLKRDANFSDYKKRGAGTSAVFCSSCSLCIVRTANAASRAAAAAVLPRGQRRSRTSNASGRSCVHSRHLWACTCCNCVCCAVAVQATQ